MFKLTENDLEFLNNNEELTKIETALKNNQNQNLKIYY